jgi:pimeloyl-ACP methyl ester carboxylesterase
MTLRTATSGDPAAPAVVFLHGLGVSRWMWDEQVRTLADRFHCVAVDLPGSGASSSEPWVSLAATATAVAEVVADVGAGRAAHVVGLSLGGYVTLALLAEHPDLVGSAIVSGVTTRPLAPAWFYRSMTRLSTALMRVPAFVRMSASALRVPADQRPAFAADTARLDPGVAGRVYGEVLEHRTPELGTAAGRLLAVAGDHEAGAVRRGLADLAAVGATAAVAPDSRHAWNGEHPELFSRMVESWVLHRALPPGLDPVTSMPVAPGPQSRRP